MDAFLITLLLTALVQMGDRTQILSAALAMRFSHTGYVLAGCAVATTINCVIAAFAGHMVGNWLSEDPRTLFYALSLLFAGLGMLAWHPRVDLLERWKTGAWVTSFLGLFILQFGDKGQFLIAATAAQNPSPYFTLFGGWLGTMLGLLPAIILQDRLAYIIPVKIIRRIGGSLLLLIGIIYVLMAYRLI